MGWTREVLLDPNLEKLSLVGLSGFEDYYPSEIIGGMKRQAGLVHAMASDPGILFFDEPSAGIDPISAHPLDDLIIEPRDSLGARVPLFHGGVKFLPLAKGGKEGFYG